MYYAVVLILVDLFKDAGTTVCVSTLPDAGGEASLDVIIITLT